MISGMGAQRLMSNLEVTELNEKWGTVSSAMQGEKIRGISGRNTLKDRGIRTMVLDS